MINKPRALSLLGETAREVGILILVFVPLDLFLEPGPISRPGVILSIGCGLVGIVLGVALEAWEWTKTP